jgi:hypothetical protein
VVELLGGRESRGVAGVISRAGVTLRDGVTSRDGVMSCGGISDGSVLILIEPRLLSGRQELFCVAYDYRRSWEVKRPRAASCRLLSVNDKIKVKPRRVLEFE